MNQTCMTSLVAQTVKRLSTMWETWVWSLGREDPLEKEMAIHSSAIAWKIPWTKELGRLQSMGSQRVGHDWTTSLSFPFPVRPLSPAAWRTAQNSLLVNYSSYWESQFLGRLIRSPGSPRRRKKSRVPEKEKGVRGSQGGKKDKLFFFFLHCFVLV